MKIAKKSDSIRILRQYLILLMAKSLHNCEKTNNYYHKLLIDNLLKEDLLKDTTFISANYDIHIDNTIAGLYKKDNPIMLDYGVVLQILILDTVGKSHSLQLLNFIKYMVR